MEKKIKSILITLIVLLANCGMNVWGTSYLELKDCKIIQKFGFTKQTEYDCKTAQKLGFAKQYGYGSFKITHNDSTYYLVTSDSLRYNTLALDSMYSFLLIQYGFGSWFDSLSANPRYIELGNGQKLFTRTDPVYEVLMMESADIKTRELAMPQGMNVEPSSYETMEDKALDYFYKYKFRNRGYSIKYYCKFIKHLTGSKPKVRHIKTRKEGHPVIGRTSALYMFMNVYTCKYGNNIIDNSVLDNLSSIGNEPEKVVVKYSSPCRNKLSEKRKIVAVFGNCIYNDMNHVEITISHGRKKWDSYIVVMRKDGSLFDIVKKEFRRVYIPIYIMI